MIRWQDDPDRVYPTDLSLNQAGDVIMLGRRRKPRRNFHLDVVWTAAAVAFVVGLTIGVFGGGR